MYYKCISNLLCNAEGKDCVIKKPVLRTGVEVREESYRNHVDIFFTQYKMKALPLSVCLDLLLRILMQFSAIEESESGGWFICVLHAYDSRENLRNEKTCEAGPGRQSDINFLFIVLTHSWKRLWGLQNLF